MRSCSIIIIGASGDLAKRKLIPALYHVIKEKKIDRFILIGAAREELTAQEMLERARAFIPTPDESKWRTLQQISFYERTDATKKEDIAHLAQCVQELEQEHQLSGARLMYLSTGANLFEIITTHAAQTGLIERKEDSDPRWHRVVYEKPFGHDLLSAQKINQTINTCLNEHQIYRIDHYLTKELVNNIAFVRFANSVFEPLWNTHTIDQVHIILNEKIGIEDRGAFYDAYGALRDVVQNHLLELLALIALDTPESLTRDALCAARARILSLVTCTDGIRGQYKGYAQEAGVKKQSQMETYALLAFEINHSRWRGVPFFIKTGKKLDTHKTLVRLRLKPPTSPAIASLQPPPNWITIELAPEAVISLSLNVRHTEKINKLVSVPMAYCHSCIYGHDTTRAYEILFEEVIQGERSAAVSMDEIEASWRIVDGIIQRDFPLFEYDQETAGPSQALAFEKKHHIKWDS